MPRTLIGASLLMLILSVVFGVLNHGKVKTLDAARTEAEAAREIAERARTAQQKEMKTREAAVAAASAKSAETETRVANAEAEMVKSQREKVDLQARIKGNEAELADLRARMQEAGPNAAPPESASGLSVTELQAQLEEARRRLNDVEREKELLAKKIQNEPAASDQPKEAKKTQAAAARRLGIRGIVLAVNQAYNFVVLNLGGRQGVETNSEMLVVRDGTLIGKISVSSVEPTTAIGDIITSTLTRGVEVQPGDTVIYAGND